MGIRISLSGSKNATNFHCIDKRKNISTLINPFQVPIIMVLSQSRLLAGLR
jgi:hypothetical protein